MIFIDNKNLKRKSIRKHLKRKIQSKDPTEHQDKSELSSKIKSEMDQELSCIKIEPGPKKYSCDNCDYATNNEVICMIIYYTETMTIELINNPFLPCKFSRN